MCSTKANQILILHSSILACDGNQKGKSHEKIKSGILFSRTTVTLV